MSILLNALAQAAVAALPVAAAEAPPAQGVIVFAPEQFASSRPANAMDMLGRIPGFTFDGGDSVRGYEGAAGNVLIDGQRPATKTDNLEQVIRRIPAQSVARIEIIRGGAPGIDMQGKSVIANIIQKSGDSFHGLAAVAHNYVLDDGRSRPATRLEASGRNGDRNWEVNLFYGHFVDDGSGDGPHLKIGPTGTILNRSLVQSEGNGRDYIIAAAYELPLLDGRLRINGRFNRNPYDYEETNRSSFPDTTAAFDHQSDDVDTGEVGLRYSRDFGPRTKLEMVGLRQTKDEVYDEPFFAPGYTEIFHQKSNTQETIGRAVLKFTQSANLSWEVGGENVLNTLDNSLRDVVNGTPVVLPAANVQVEEKRWEVFGKSTWRPGPKWTVEASLRQEGSEISSSGDVVLSKTLSYTKPRLAVTWALDPKTQLRLRYERVVGQLDFTDFTASSSLGAGVVTAGNPNLVPEQAWVSEVAVERRFWGAGAAVLTLRHSAITDVVDRAPVFTATGVFDAPANIGDGTKDEVIATLTLPFEKLHMKGAQLQVNSTWRETEVTDPTTLTKRPSSKLKPQEWDAHFTWDLPQYNLSWGIDAFGAWRKTFYRSNVVDIQKLKTYVQPFIEWKPKPDFSLRVEAGNFTSRGLRRTQYVYSGPRGASPLAFVDDRDIQFGQMLYFRLRKTFD